MDESEKKTVIEDFVSTMSGFGYRVEFIGDDCWQDFNVYQISSFEVDGDKEIPLLNKRGYLGSGEHVRDIKDAQVMVGGHVKWDGCMEFDLQEEPHFCDREMVSMFGDMLKWVHKRALEIMGREPE